MVARILLTSGKTALVDQEDYERVSRHVWTEVPSSRTSYACTRIKIDGVWKTIRMHRLIDHTPVGVEVDHRDHCGLNNQKDNLRRSTRKQNGSNRSANKLDKKSSQYKGVVLAKWNKNPKWVAAITPNRKRIYLGSFIEEKEAALAYDKAALEHFGEFADLNFER